MHKNMGKQFSSNNRGETMENTTARTASNSNNDNKKKSNEIELVQTY